MRSIIAFMDVNPVETPDQQPGERHYSKELPGSRIHIKADLAAGERINIRIASSGVDSAGYFGRAGKFGVTPIAFPNWLKAVWRFLATHLTWETSLFGSGLIIYLATRFIGLAQFPIYFFTDEAVQTMLASDLIRDGWRGGDGVLLPTFFVNGYQYNLGVSVYLQVLPALLWARQIWITRGVSVLVTILAAVCVGLSVKKVFNKPYAWVAILFLSITPAWFLHSRTAFETSEAVAFYAGMIYFYMRYRADSPKSLIPAVIMAGLCFYAYAPAKMVVAVTAVLMALSDLRYHWQQRRTVLIAMGVAALVVAPFIRFNIIHPDANEQHLRQLSSYWIEDYSLGEKLGMYFNSYVAGLNPLYWFLPNDFDLNRHLMKNYGHILSITFPFVVLGLGIALRNFRTSAYRTLLIALLAAPSGAALVELGITRALFMVIPMALFAAIGLIAVLQWVERRWQVKRIFMALLLFIAMAGINVLMLEDALINGPTWYDDYGMSGMQYGGQQLFDSVKQYLKEKPGVHLIVSPSWANGTDVVARFFFTDPMPFDMGNIDTYITRKTPLDDNTVFLMIPEEYQRALDSDKFTNFRIDETLLYPNGSPGFYYVRLDYVKNIDQIFAEEETARKVLQEAKLDIYGTPAVVKYSYLDMGDISKIFDKDSQTLIRSMEANPMRIDIQFLQPVPISQLDLKIGGTPTFAKAELLDSNNKVLDDASLSVPSQPNPRTVILSFKNTYQVTYLNLVVQTPNENEPAHVHLWDVAIK
jgi:4-amino-4-deoxy-L-arabinose transferase-like glycosyltransferase